MNVSTRGGSENNVRMGSGFLCTGALEFEQRDDEDGECISQVVPVSTVITGFFALNLSGEGDYDDGRVGVFAKRNVFLEIFG